MKSKETKSIFELIEIEYDCDYNEEKDEYESPQYPLFNIRRDRIGIFSSIAKAEQGIKDYVEEKKKDGKGREKDLFGFLIEEYSLDKFYFWEKSMRNYLPDGSLLDECLVSSDPDEEGNLEEFLGRPAEKVRYRNGNLVEELFSGNTVRLSIIGNPPFSPEKVSEYKTKYWNESGFHQDSTDDTYYACGDCDDDGDYIHSHPSPVDLFPLRFPVSDELRKNLEKSYKRYCEGF